MLYHEVPHSVFLGSYLNALLAVAIGNREVGGEGPEKYYLLYQELSACMNEKADRVNLEDVGYNGNEGDHTK